MDLSSAVTELGGVGEAAAKRLAKLGIKTIEDLLLYYPRKYNDFSKITPIGKLKPGPVTIKGQILRAVTRRTRRRNFTITEAVIDDGTGAIKATWFNQPYLAKSLPKETPIYASGNLEFKYNQYAILNPVIERVSEFTKDTARIVPVYSETKDLSSKQIRSFIKQSLALAGKLPELLPAPVLRAQGLRSKAEALKQIHFPDSIAKLEQAKHRLAFEELWLLILTSLIIKAEIQTESSPSVTFDEDKAKAFVGSLGFKLTNGQRKAAWQILQDLERPIPMNRLLEGDVGSGKTVVAVLVALMAITAGYQVALLAPTEILARQHFDNIEQLLKPFKIKPEFLAGSHKTTAKQAVYKKIKAGTSQFIIGTHALLQEAVEFKSLGLVIIDEQHRFGVEQRSILKTKARRLPHLLTMSATPIPRSLALTIYGDLDISVIDELPSNRQPVTTQLVKSGDRPRVYRHIDDEIKKSRQVYVVCPLISDSDKLGVRSAEAEAERLASGPFKNRKIGVLHGRLKPVAKEQVMRSFKKGQLDILVSTTVVEVGVDVPKATIMLVEGAERFGLAQLHQLRGRVGRAEHQSYCYLLPSEDNKSEYRLSLLEKYHDGFTLAQKDLEIRGPGQIYGQLQHGLLDLRLADLTDTKLIATARQSAQAFLAKEDIDNYPDLLAAINQLKGMTRLD